jgi:hypothetical protein
MLFRRISKIESESEIFWVHSDPKLWPKNFHMEKPRDVSESRSHSWDGILSRFDQTWISAKTNRLRCRKLAEYLLKVPTQRSQTCHHVMLCLGKPNERGRLPVSPDIIARFSTIFYFHGRLVLTVLRFWSSHSFWLSMNKRFCELLCHTRHKPLILNHFLNSSYIINHSISPSSRTFPKKVYERLQHLNVSRTIWFWR